MAASVYHSAQVAPILAQSLLRSVPVQIVETLLAGPYNVGFASAVTLGLALAIRSGRARRFPLASWYAVLGAALAAGIVGSKLIFLDFQPIAPGEKTILGALILGILAALAAASTFGIGAWRALDAMSLPTLAAMAVGRVGCFLADCCTGTHSELPWAVASPRDGASVHPVQLYEAAGDLVLIALLKRRSAAARDGQRFLAATLGYIGLRVATEFLRNGRTLYGPLNLVQWSLLVIGLVLTVVALRRAEPLRVAERATAMTTRSLPAIATAATIAVVVALGGAWFVPLEQLVMLGLALALALAWIWAVVPRGVWRLAPLAPLAMAPRAGAVLILQEPSAVEETRSSILVGGNIRSGRYHSIVGEELLASCDGEYSDPTIAFRDQLNADVRVGYERERGSGSRLRVEGRYLGGVDRLDRIEEGPVFNPPASKVATQAGGLSLLSERPGGMWRVGVMAGSLSKEGTAASGIVPSAAFRFQLTPRFYAHGAVAAKEYFPSLGEFSYIGAGYSRGFGRARFAIGVGEGGIFEMMLPVASTELEMTYRTVSESTNARSGSLFTLGFTQRVRLR